MADREAAMLDPLDGFSLYMLFQQAKPFAPEEEYNWDPKPIWQDPMDPNSNPLQGYATPNYMTHYAEDDLVQEDPRVLGDHISTFSSVFDSVCDADHDPEEFPRPDVSYPSNGDCGTMVTNLVPPANLWDVDEVADIQVGTKVWAVNHSLTEGGLWDVPFTANPEPITEVALVTDLSFWDSLLMRDLAEDLGVDMEVPKSTIATNKGKGKLREVPADLWDVNEDPQVVPSSGNMHNVTRSGRIFQPANLQAGTSSSPSNPRNEPFAFPRSAPFEVLAGPPNADLVQRQLEQIYAAVSIWGLICSSWEHCQKLCHALSCLEIQVDVTPETMVSLILPPTSKNTVAFTDKDLPVDGVDHNYPLNIIRQMSRTLGSYCPH
ncbi:hypothetical protein RHMOL_Rhmol11G0005400 [Rhododendron molle]|uniref:Uncharacterized protein n=1 Tax=Rhododendron molle TaxID=49168 RepID=A0ACC0LNU2_RHOML|nr:hypothetical protein RHMOL_Rhmol11G0005400 [Rhododendron molle]